MLCIKITFVPPPTPNCFRQQGGHNGYSGVSEYHRDTAREYAFVLAAVNGWHDPRGSSGHVHDEL